MKARLMDNLREQSNGESAYFCFTSRIQENGLYLLDDPENSLSPARQQELVQFLEDSTRFFGCQFIIATHSPFLLAMRGAKIYDLDADPVCTRRWNSCLPSGPITTFSSGMQPPLRRSHRERYPEKPGGLGQLFRQIPALQARRQVH